MLTGNLNLAQSFVREVAVFGYHQLPDRTQVARNVQKIVVPSLAALGAMQMQTVQADPYMDCVDSCNKQPHPLTKTVCYLLCLLFAK